MYSINSISSKYSFPYHEHTTDESELKNINFANISKLNISGAYPKKKTVANNKFVQKENDVIQSQNVNQTQLSFDLLDKAFDQFCKSSKAYLYGNIEKEAQLLNRIEAKFSNVIPQRAFLQHRRHSSILQKETVGRSKTIYFYLVLGLKRSNSKDMNGILVYEKRNIHININSNNSNNQLKSNKKLIDHNQIHQRDDEEIIQCATQNSSNNESSSISNRYLHKIKKFLLKLGNKYQTVHHKNQKDILFSIFNSFYSITIERKTHKICSLNKKELYKEEVSLKNEAEISLQLQNIYKGLKYLRNKQKVASLK